MRVVTLVRSEYLWALFLRRSDPLPYGASCFKVTRHGAAIGRATYAANVAELQAAGIDLAELAAD